MRRIVDGLYRANCISQLFERSRFTNEIGAAIHLSPNANGVLQRLGVDAKKFGAVETELVGIAYPHGKIPMLTS